MTPKEVLRYGRYHTLVNGDRGGLGPAPLFLFSTLPARDSGVARYALTPGYYLLPLRGTLCLVFSLSVRVSHRA